MTVRAWYAKPSAGAEMHGQWLIIDETTGANIAIVYDGAAHARLIAQAPMMAKALRIFLDLMDDGGAVFLAAIQHPDDINAACGIGQAALAAVEDA